MRPHAAPGSPGDGLVDAVALVGDRWTLLLIEQLLGGPRRFGELADGVDGIAPNVLTARLRQMEVDGLVRSTPYSLRPLRVEYELTGAGRELAGALALMATWGRRQRSGPSRSTPAGAGPEHRACGTTLEARLWCPTCAVVVDDPDGEHLEHL
jgi:DNA-binding HxlR family transcriptional regulator